MLLSGYFQQDNYKIEFLARRLGTRLQYEYFFTLYPNFLIGNCSAGVHCISRECFAPVRFVTVNFYFFALRCKCPNADFFFWSVFSCIRLNTEIYGVNLGIQSEYRKIRTRKNSVFAHFARSAN